MSRPTGRVRRRGGIVLALVLLVAAGGCASSAPDPAPTGAATGGPGAASAGPTPSEAPPAGLHAGSSADDVRAAGAPLTSGALTLALAPLGGAVEVEVEADGSLVVSLDAPDLPDAGAALVAAPVGYRFETSADGSVTVLDAADAFVGALARPGVGRTRSGGAVYEPVAPDLLRLAPGPGPVPERVTIWFGTTLVESLSWGEREGGRSLAVDPTDWARAAGPAVQEATWAAVVAAEPEADTAGMRAQFLCHALGARDKETWNLEPWRPEVDSLEMLAARCNPT